MATQTPTNTFGSALGKTAKAIKEAATYEIPSGTLFDLLNPAEYAREALALPQTLKGFGQAVQEGYSPTPVTAETLNYQASGRGQDPRLFGAVAPPAKTLTGALGTGKLPGATTEGAPETAEAPKDPARIQELIDAYKEFGKQGLGLVAAQQGALKTVSDNLGDQTRASASGSGSSNTDYGWQMYKDLMVKDFEAGSLAPGDAALAQQRFDMFKKQLGFPPQTSRQQMAAIMNATQGNPQARQILITNLWNAVEQKADGGVVGMGMESPVAEPSVEMESGDYVIPADVLRFYGTKFFQSLIEKADQP